MIRCCYIKGTNLYLLMYMYLEREFETQSLFSCVALNIGATCWCMLYFWGHLLLTELQTMYIIIQINKQITTEHQWRYIQQYNVITCLGMEENSTMSTILALVLPYCCKCESNPTQMNV